MWGVAMNRNQHKNQISTSYTLTDSNFLSRKCCLSIDQKQIEKKNQSW